MTYIGNTAFKHGKDFGEPPTATVVLSAGEELTSIYGTNNFCIRTLGFTTSWGSVYGPWGESPGPLSFSLTGPIYGVYGGMADDIFGSIGIWTTDPPPSPAPIPAPNPVGMRRSKMFGGSAISQWDDGSKFAGKAVALYGWQQL